MESPKFSAPREIKYVTHIVRTAGGLHTRVPNKIAKGYDLKRGMMVEVTLTVLKT